MSDPHLPRPSDLTQMKAALDRAGIPYEEQPGLAPGAHKSLAVGTNDEATSVFGLGGGYVGVFGFDASGALIEFGVMV